MSTLVANPEDRFSRYVAHIFVDAGFVFTKIYLSKMRDPFGMALLRMAYEPQHDKTNKVTVRPAKTQMSLGIRPIWSESSLCAEWVAKDPRFLHADSEDSDQTDLSLRWARSHFVGFVMSRLICVIMIKFLTIFTKEYANSTGENASLQYTFLLH